MKNGDIIYVVFGTTVLEAQMVSDFYTVTQPSWWKKEICRVKVLKRYDLYEGWTLPGPDKVDKVTGVPRTNVIQIAPVC